MQSDIDINEEMEEYSDDETYQDDEYDDNDEYDEYDEYNSENNENEDYEETEEQDYTYDELMEAEAEIQQKRADAIEKINQASFFSLSGVKDFISSTWSELMDNEASRKIVIDSLSLGSAAVAGYLTGGTGSVVAAAGTRAFLKKQFKKKKKTSVNQTD